ncbi:Glycosyltransferase, GT2 family [Formivibrio citricus]|uniref:Glycosyltransferase, GT2 family n=1 Tax=Formivibrio citricus TaxID=83765 RepID=A0A1I4VBF8_9NEIS|nr:glycosyltransferase [Formivibrio citricus]SFM98531.1 Glycosyltransferase, GT2 family [Formivibrio citricus]
MKQSAIVSFLWPRFQRALTAFCLREPGAVILTPAGHCDPNFLAQIEQLGGKVVALESLLGQEAHESAHREVNTALTDLDHYFESAGWKEKAGVLDADDAQLAAVLKGRAHAEVPGLAHIVEMLSVAAEQYDIRLVVLSEDVTVQGKTAAICARRNQVPSLQVMHGVALAKPFTVHGALFADYVAVYGQRGLESYLDVDVDPKRCFLTGNPAWDHYPAWMSDRPACRSRLDQRYKLQKDAPIVVFATTWAHYLTATADPKVFERTLTQFFEAVAELQRSGLKANFVVKGRGADANYDEVAQAAGLEEGDYLYATADTEDWVCGSDIVIGADSNIEVESMMAGTPTINLMNWFGLRLGPSFDAQSGVIEVEGRQLAQAIARLLTDPDHAAEQRQQLLAAAPRYNLGVDGKASERVGELMQRLMRPIQEKKYLWQQFLDVEDMDASGYHDVAKSHLVDMITCEPKIALDIGCAAGGTGALVKQRFAGCQVWGFELNRAAARMAANRLDRVLVGKFEDFDLELEGIAKGSVDVVILADVLEHMYNPWQVMTRLRPYLSPKAQVIVSIPNVRNLALMEDLARGNWRYDSWGLLDITHIRFFTYAEMVRFFQETGYRVAHNVWGIDDRLRDLYHQYKDVCPATIDTGKMVLKDVSIDELGELCSLQFWMVAEPADEQAQAPVHDSKQRAYARYLQDHSLSPVEANQFELRMAQWPHHPRYHFAIMAHNLPGEALLQTIRSFSEQYYYNVRLTVLSDQPAPAGLAEGQLEWWQTRGELFAEINSVFAETDADWCGVVSAGDQVARHALLFVSEALHTHPDWQAVYGDEDALDAYGNAGNALFKPDFSIDYLRSLPYAGSFVLFKCAAQAPGSFDATYPGNEIYDRMLRVYEQGGAKAIGHVAEVLFHRAHLQRYDDLPTQLLVDSGMAAVRAHLARSQVKAQVESGLLPGSYRVKYALDSRPLVSILIPTREKPGQLQRCLEGILDGTDYGNYEVLIVDHQSQTPQARAYLDQLIALDSESLRVYNYPGDFNYADINNLAASEARGEYLLLLNNDTAPLDKGWLTELVSQLSQPGIGAVGARLLFPDGKVQQAGFVLGLEGAAETPFFNLSHEDPGYLGRAHTVQEVTAVSASCMLVRRDAYEAVGGFDTRYDVAYADVEFCLRMRQVGHRILWTPHASLMHDAGATMRDESLSAGLQERIVANQTDFLRLNLPALARDPFYNPNLSLREKGCNLEQRKALTWNPLTWRPLPRILAHTGDNMGCGHYRVIEPMSAATLAGKIEGSYSFGYFMPAEMARFEVDTWYLQRQFMPGQRDLLKRYKEIHPCKIVFELDDLITNLPKKNVHGAGIPKEVGDWLAESLSLCDRFIVTTDYLAEQYRHMIDDVRVVNNTVYGAKWLDLKPQRRTSRKPRVGWGGGVSHTGDLELIVDVVKELANEVDWIFFGLCPDAIRPYVKEYHPGIPIDQYPQKLASLNLDLAIAPLEIHPFNEAKSNLRLLEYGILGYPVICTDILPYQGDFPVTRLRNDPTLWTKTIREHVSDLDECARMGDSLREHVIKHWLLENKLDEWVRAWLD